jgi:hypothetical protein
MPIPKPPRWLFWLLVAFGMAIEVFIGICTFVGFIFICAIIGGALGWW